MFNHKKNDKYMGINNLEDFYNYIGLSQDSMDKHRKREAEFYFKTRKIP